MWLHLQFTLYESEALAIETALCVVNLDLFLDCCLVLSYCWTVTAKFPLSQGIIHHTLNSILLQAMVIGRISGLCALFNNTSNLCPVSHSATPL